MTRLQKYFQNWRSFGDPWETVIPPCIDRPPVSDEVSRSLMGLQCGISKSHMFLSSLRVGQYLRSFKQIQFLLTLPFDVIDIQKKFIQNSFLHLFPNIFLLTEKNRKNKQKNFQPFYNFSDGHVLFFLVPFLYVFDRKQRVCPF